MLRTAALTATLLTLSGAFGTSAAQAHRLHKGKNETQAHFAHRLVHHAQTGIRWIKTHPTNFRTYHRYRKALRDHRWLLQRGKEIQNKLAKAASVVAIPPHYNEWMCIHSYEGAWDDPGAPYYGGLQMDWNFMKAYGASLLREKGPANNWTPLEQMWVAENAINAGRGFYPWPNTARYCGLI